MTTSDFGSEQPSRPSEHYGVPGVRYPVHYEIDYPQRLSRGLIFVKWLLVFPHIVVLYALGIASGFVTIVAWFAILFTGRYPLGMFNFNVGVQRWSARVSAYFLLMTDDYPPFSLDDR